MREAVLVRIKKNHPIVPRCRENGRNWQYSGSACSRVKWRAVVLRDCGMAARFFAFTVVNLIAVSRNTVLPSYRRCGTLPSGETEALLCISHRKNH